MRALALLALFGACASAPVRVEIAAFNDLHGNLEPPSEPWFVPEAKGGLAELAAHVGALRARSQNTVVVAAGDLIGASPLASALVHDEPTIEALNALGLEVNAIGNHELDEGVDELLRVMNGGCHPSGCVGGPRWEGARFANIAANVWREGSKETLFAASWVKTIDGIPLGFIGLAPSSTPAHQPAWFRGARFTAEAEAANAEAERLLARGVRALVLVVHEGLVARGGLDGCEGPSGELLPIVAALHPAIRLVISGHTHRAYVCELGGRVVTSAGSYGRAYTQISIELSRDGELRVLSAKNRVVDASLPRDPKVGAIVDRWVEHAREVGDREVGRVRAEISRTVDPAGNSALGALVADAQLEATRAAGAEASLMHTRGLRSAIAFERSGREAEDGVVSFAEIAAVHPFSNRLMTLTVTGAELLAFLDESYAGDEEPRYLVPSATLSWTWAARRVVPGSLRLGGRPVPPERELRLTVNDFLAGRGALAKARDVVTGPTDAEALAAYLKARSPYAPVAAPRVARGD